MFSHINNDMTNKHYDKYKETIKKVARRNYYKRVQWLNKILENESCLHCGESETVCLKFHPHDKEIRNKIKRVGMNSESRKEVEKLINDSFIVCANCKIKIDNELIDTAYQSLL